MLVSCPLPPGSDDPPQPGAALTCRFPCGATSPGSWVDGRVTCALPPGVDGVVVRGGGGEGAATPPAAVATVDVAPPPPPPPPPPPRSCCGGRPCGPGTVITSPPAAAPPAWMARACVDGIPASALAGSAAWVRADLNVPLRPDGSVADASRLDAAVPTIAFLLAGGVRVVAVASHLGRPAGPDPAASLARLAPALERALRAGGLPASTAVTFVPASTGPAVAAAVAAAAPGSVLLVENVRFHGPAETGNDPGLAAALAPPGVFDLVVNDAFGAAHRGHASTAGVAAAAVRAGRPAVAGLLLRAELAALGRTLCCPRRPLVALVGGAKLSTKARILERLVTHADAVVLGGSLATTFLAALSGGGGGGGGGGGRGGEEEEAPPSVGGGVEPAEFAAARAAAAAAAAAGTRLILPIDVVAAPRTPDGRGWDAARAVTVPATAVPPGFTALDAGPATVAAVAALADGAWTVVWNGPFGLAEDPAFAAGTAGVAAALAPLAATRGTTTIVGGGHSVAAVAAAGLTASFSHVSTGGGATLELLEGAVLPGVAALQEGPGLAGVCDV